MLSRADPRAEPRENNRYASANRLPGLKAAGLAQKQQRRFRLLLEPGDVRTVQINFCRTPGGGDFQQRQLAVSGEKLDLAEIFSKRRGACVSVFHKLLG